MLTPASFCNLHIKIELVKIKMVTRGMLLPSEREGCRWRAKSYSGVDFSIVFLKTYLRQFYFHMFLLA